LNILDTKPVQEEFEDTKGVIRICTLAMTMQIIIDWLCKNLPSPIVGVTTTAKIKQILNRKFCFEKHVAIFTMYNIYTMLVKKKIKN
jgi:hypothetical protein